MIMNLTYTPSASSKSYGTDCRATLDRLIGNLSGFVYRRRHDAYWTMEFVSPSCLDVTGYEPHRLIGNASIAFANLISRSDWKRVNERVRMAALNRQRTTIEYRVRVAHGAWIEVEDRLTPVVDAAGNVLAIEGVIDRARSERAKPRASLSPDETRLTAICSSPSSN